MRISDWSSDVCSSDLDLGGDPQILEKARMTARDQAREAEELERMLQSGGTTAQPTAEVQPTSEPSSSRPEQVAPAPAPKEKDTPAPKADTKEAPDADPHAEIGSASRGERA